MCSLLQVYPSGYFLASGVPIGPGIRNTRPNVAQNATLGWVTLQA